MPREGDDPARAIGVDTGGTFTDLVIDGPSGRRALKVLSTPRQPAHAVIEGLRLAGAGRTTRVHHGSTVATNALLERKGARVTFVTTSGVEDVLEIGRQQRPDLHALVPTRPEPLVPASRRIGVAERVEAGGAVRRLLSEREIRRVVREVRATSPEAIAIGLLHAWSHPAHEQRLAEALRALGVPISVSSRIAPEIREFERFATTCANAFLEPQVRRYLEMLAGQHFGPLEVVLSHGGTAPASRAAGEPVRQLLSGPAAGLRAALSAARACGFDSALTLDVGGTSTDCAFLGGEGAGSDGLPRTRGREVAGIPILLPTLEVHTVGAGGGSIAHVDDQGVLHVGPASAGADPGPACYGRGGPATVTDALAVLGMLPATGLAGGALPIDFAAAEQVMRPIARALGMRRPRDAAEAIRTLADAHMERALRKVSVERGEDPRAAALVAFGGAGGLHACALAESLDVRAIVWPRHAGVLCALGALEGGSRRERSQGVLLPASEGAVLARVLARLRKDVAAEFKASERSGVRIECWAEARYAGQAHELALPAEPIANLGARFHALHERRYGFADPTRQVVVVTLDARGHRPSERAEAVRARPRLDTGDARRRAKASGGVHDRESLAVGSRIVGPALLIDEGASCVVASGWTAELHASGAALLTQRRRR